MIKPWKITDYSFVITVIAFADLHGSDLCQTHFQVAPESVLVQRLTAGLHMALNNRFRVRKDKAEQWTKHGERNTYEKTLSKLLCLHEQDLL